MTRIHIDMPDRFIFSVEMPVRITDINYGQHLGHDALMSILHEARVNMLQSKGLSEIDIGGCGLIMADTGIVYRAEVLYGTTLKVELAVENMSKSRFDVYYRVTDAKDGRTVADAKTGMVCFDYEKKRPARMPEVFREAF